MVKRMKSFPILVEVKRLCWRLKRSAIRDL